MIEVVTLRARPDLRAQLFSGPMHRIWPTFMMNDRTADLFFEAPHFESNLDTAFAIIDPNQPTVAVGRAFAVPFALEGVPDRGELPDSGWDGVIRWAHADRSVGRPADSLSALEIALLPTHRGRGASTTVLDAMRAQARSLGLKHMFAPVRPTAKHLEPHTPMVEYAARTREDGRPADPWLRVHTEAGGAVVKVAPTSMMISGTIADWHRWTGLEFTVSGPSIVPGALVPVHVSVEQNHAVYVEPNVWVRHTIPA